MRVLRKYTLINFKRYLKIYKNKNKTLSSERVLFDR